MKFVLLFWLAYNQPTTAVFNDAQACVYGLRQLQSEFATDARVHNIHGLCLPYSYKDDKSYRAAIKDTNPG